MHIKEINLIKSNLVQSNLRQSSQTNVTWSTPDLGVENLLLTMTEVLKRQSTRYKMGYNQVRAANPVNHSSRLSYSELTRPPWAASPQLCVSEVRVDRVCVRGCDGITFAVCLDQDEKRIIQGVSRYSLTISPSL